ncbi:hypothetical protein JL193_03100 [Polaribacter batillariae]|uniref:Uncharacterized protein n=1 Tax=Polaribacter batillariae TaxID=2808900 RepID=A0ABX7SXU3_9FLAO|nr:hypothetical protein [Polaribacter batillariae]QTD38303.1 hypothetical protein JL193_03100 [Polaribacter batillariae]
MLIVYIFLVLAGVILLFISIKRKNKRFSNLVNFLLTTIATLIGVIMAINVSVNNEMKKEKEDLVKILESGVYVVEKITKYVESSTKEKLSIYKKMQNNLELLKANAKDSLTSFKPHQQKASFSKENKKYLDSLKFKLDSLKTIFKNTVLRNSDSISESSSTRTISILNFRVKLPFPDYIGSLLKNPDFLKGLSKRSLLILNEDYINLQRTYLFNNIEELENDPTKTMFYILALHKIKRTLQVETAFQENKITQKQLDHMHFIMDRISNQELTYNIAKINMQVTNKFTLKEN